MGFEVKAAFSMESKAVKSAFVRTGVMRVSSGAVEGFLVGLIKIVCSCTWSRPHWCKSTVMVSTFSKPYLR